MDKYFVPRESFEPVSVLPRGINNVCKHKEQLEFIFDYCTKMAVCEKDALKEDDINGACAANHRGAIHAYHKVARVCAELLRKNEQG